MYSKTKLLGVPLPNAERNRIAELLEAKFDMVMQGAYMANAEALLVSDEGCAEAGLSPAVLGKAFGHALKTTAYRPAELLLTGSSEFVVAARHAAGLTDDDPVPSSRPATYRPDS